MTFKVVLEPSDEGGYTSYVPALHGCVSEGDMLEEALQNIYEAIELYLELLEKPPVQEGQIDVCRLQRAEKGEIALPRGETTPRSHSRSYTNRTTKVRKKTSVIDDPLLKVPPARRGNRVGAPFAVPLAKRGNLKLIRVQRFGTESLRQGRFFSAQA